MTYTSTQDIINYNAELVELGESITHTPITVSLAAYNAQVEVAGSSATYYCLVRDANEYSVKRNFGFNVDIDYIVKVANTDNITTGDKVTVRGVAGRVVKTELDDLKIVKKLLVKKST